MRVIVGYNSYRPDIDAFEAQDFVKDCMRRCWAELPEQRPDLTHVRALLAPMFKELACVMRRLMLRGLATHDLNCRKMNIMDHMINVMEEYQENLEKLVDQRTAELQEEKNKVLTLMHRMMPQ